MDAGHILKAVSIEMLRHCKNTTRNKIWMILQMNKNSINIRAKKINIIWDYHKQIKLMEPHK